MDSPPHIDLYIYEAILFICLGLGTPKTEPEFGSLTLTKWQDANSSGELLSITFPTYLSDQRLLLRTCELYLVITYFGALGFSCQWEFFLTSVVWLVSTAHVVSWCVCVCVCVCLVAQSYLTLCNSMDCSPPDFPVHGILQERILEWVAMSSSRGPSRPSYWTHVSCISCIADRFFYHRARGGSLHIICMH